MATVTEPEFETLDPHVLRHLTDMGFGSVNEYRQWCIDHGFSRGINKHPTLRAAERAVRFEKFHADQKQRRREARQPIVVLQAICRGELLEEQVQQPALRWCAQRIQAESDTIDRQAFTQFVDRLVSLRAKFLIEAVHCTNPRNPTSGWIDGLLNVCRFQSDWMRPLNDWRPRVHNARRQFASLLRHLFAKYDDIPVFMDSAWFVTDAHGAAYREWFLHLGRGQNLRHCQLPLGYTKRMAHFFMQAPNELSIPQALRYGQVLGLGADQRTAHAILGTRLGTNFEHQDFWTGVVRWFLQHPMLDRAQIGPIIDYIHHQKFEAEIAVRQPNFSMLGRTPYSLLRQVHRWHDSLAKDNRIQVCEWKPLDIPAFEFVEGQDVADPAVIGQLSHKRFKRWTIRELVSSQALVIEGQQLGHCVASYAQSCARRLKSIWTMEQTTEAGVTKLLTLEVCPNSHKIVQARGRFNRLPKEQEVKILQRWADEARLSIGCI